MGGAAWLGCEIQHWSTQEHLRSCHRKGPQAALPFLKMSHTHPQRAHGCGAAPCGSRCGDRQPADAHWQQHLAGGRHTALLHHRNRSMNLRQHQAGNAGQPWAQPAPVPCLSFPSRQLTIPAPALTAYRSALGNIHTDTGAAGVKPGQRRLHPSPHQRLPPPSSAPAAPSRTAAGF